MSDRPGNASMQGGTRAWVIDCRSPRLAAICSECRHFGIAEVNCDSDVPSPERFGEAIQKLGERWLVLVHVHNERSLDLAMALVGFLGVQRRLLLYSGGGSVNFDGVAGLLMPKGSGVEYVKFISAVNADNLSTLRITLRRLGPPFVNAKDDGRNTDGVRLSGGSGADDALRSFEMLRSHVSHDLFTNGFCSAMGFHCTDPESPRRADQLLWARADRQWWTLLRTAAMGWSSTEREVEEVLTAAECIAGERVTDKCREIIRKARVGLASIQSLMNKFTGPIFEEAILSDEEICRFWESTDAVRLALHAVRVTDDGFNAEVFGC